MFGLNLKKHINEFSRYVRNYQYEKGDGFIYFPKASATAGGLYIHNVNGEDERSDHNIIPDEGLNYILNQIMLTSAAAVPRTWYCMLHSGSGTPSAAITAANYHATVTEITSGAEGYSQATRVLWVGDAVDTANTEVVNLASPAAFTIVTATSLVVNGAGLTSVSTKGATSGTLISAGKFSASRTLANADTFNLKYKVDLDAA